MSINNNSNNYNYSGNLLQLQDGNYTDATIQGQGSEIIINNNAVNFAKMQNIDTNRLLGRSTVGTGIIEEITIGSGLTLSAGTLSASGGGVADADYGDITVTGTGSVWTIDNSVVSYAKIQNVSTNNKLLGRSTTGAGVVEEITIGSGLTLSAGTLSASGGGGGYQIQTDIITTSGTWTKPAFAKRVKVYILPGGGGGGSGARRATTSARCGGAGGSACGYTSAEFNATSLTSTVTATVGAGGSGGASVSTNDTNGNAGVAGGATSFGAYIATDTNGAGGGGATASTVSSIPGFGSAGFLISSAFFDGRQGTTTTGTSFSSSSFSLNTSLGGGGGAGAPANGTTTASGGSTKATNWAIIFPTVTFGNAGVAGGNGGNGSSTQIGSLLYINTGGGGGSYITGQATGSGGNGGYGAGGGGGASSDNGFASGAGGSGGGGLIIVISEG